MICFEIFINGEKKCTVGVSADNHSEPDKVANLMASVSVSHSDPDALKRLFGEDDPDLWKNGHPELTVYGRIGRVRDTESYCWLENEVLSVGDDVTIRIVETHEVDTPELTYDPNIRMWAPTDTAKARGFREKLYAKLRKEFE